MNRIHVRLLPIVVAAVSFAARAEEGGHGGHGEPHVSNWWGIGKAYSETPALGFLMVTFAVFVAGVIYFARKPIAEHLETRADTVEKAIAEATRARKDAEARAAEAEAKLAALGDEVKKMKSEFETQGKAEAARIEAAAQELAARVARDAEDTITAEIERARESLRVEASRLALQLAEERIKAALQSTDDVRLQKSLIQDLSA